MRLYIECEKYDTANIFNVSHLIFALIKFVLCDGDTPSERVVNYLYAYRSDGLRLPKPQFVLSITGEARHFKFEQETEKIFKKGFYHVEIN